ncbi:hypothetical protein [Herbiconiux liangxiaofengii]|uniref:hypothetical protein n=1 Tax=Herbiconiux liangxiaofengii TaxID=3342795 RepID=UPI0035B6D68E
MTEQIHPNGGEPAEGAVDAFRIDVDTIRPGVLAEPGSVGRHHPKGRFYRPELYSTREKVLGSFEFKAGMIVVLVATAGALLALAVGSGAIL